MIEFVSHPDWLGTYPKWQQEGAWPNGTRIVKARSEKGDGTPDGTQGTVLASLSHPDVGNGVLMYWVEWDNAKQIAVACVEGKLAKAQP